MCPSYETCGSIYDYDLESDETQNNALIQYSIHTFDNLATSLMSVFQIITKDGWTVFLYNLTDSRAKEIATIFCVIQILFGSYFIINLILAVILEKFTVVQQFEFEAINGIQNQTVWSSSSEDFSDDDDKD